MPRLHFHLGDGGQIAAAGLILLMLVLGAFRFLLSERSANDELDALRTRCEAAGGVLINPPDRSTTKRICVQRIELAPPPQQRKGPVL